jgi:hypothetical protein
LDICCNCDILFTQPGCPAEFVRSGPDWETAKIRFSHIKRYNETGRLRDIHAGSFIVHREHSQLTLALWAYEISKGHGEGDNDAYIELYNEIEDSQSLPEDFVEWQATQKQQLPTVSTAKTASTTTLATTKSSSKATTGSKAVDTKKPVTITSDKNNNNNNPKMKFHNPLEAGEASTFHSNDPSNPILRFEKFLELETSRKSCMQHISKARCSVYGREKVQQYVNRFQLRTYHHHHTFLTSRPPTEEEIAGREGSTKAIAEREKERSMMIKTQQVDDYDYYCVHPMLMTFLYGWFPLSYIPFCPKFEKIL